METRLNEAVKSDYPFVTETSAHLVEAGGKRFRPLMALLCAAFGDPDREEVYDAATVVELTHLATLYHDDVMDEAPMRRGRPSANNRWDNSVAILTGDFLFSRASDILADLGPDAVRIQARTFERLVTGQIRETVGPADGEDPVAHHLQVLADKTGSLIATSAQFGAMFAGCDQPTVDTLTRYGERIGVAFQLADDLVDLTSESADSGKTPGTDLKEGVPTLTGLMVLRDGADIRLADLLSRPLGRCGSGRGAVLAAREPGHGPGPHGRSAVGRRRAGLLGHAARGSTPRCAGRRVRLRGGPHGLRSVARVHGAAGALPGSL